MPAGSTSSDDATIETPKKIPSSHDPACDQCRIKKIRCGREQPRCSNCERSSLGCTWTNKGKKKNQTKRLINDFQDFGQRLAQLEEDVAKANASLEKLLQSLTSITNYAPKASTPAAQVDESSFSAAVGKIPDNLSRKDTGYVTYSTEGDERYHGSSSLLSLFSDADKALNENMEKFKPKATLQEMLLHRNSKEDELPFWDSFAASRMKFYRNVSQELTLEHSLDLSHDGMPLMLPPKRLLDLIVEPYFKHINPITPLLEQSRCLEAIETCYTNTSTETDPAWIIIFNYIIIRCFVGRYMPLERPSSDVDLASTTQSEQPFITNIRRGFACLNRFMKPSLLHVQALSALTLIAQKYFPVGVTEILLNHACYVAMSMGLHQERSVNSNLNAVQIDERRYVFWTLFTIDKEVSMLMGFPPGLPSYDCDVLIPNILSSDYRCRIRGTMIRDKTYTALYSAAAIQKNEVQKEEAIKSLEEELHQYLQMLDQDDPEDINSGWAGETFLRLELRFAYYFGRVMVLRQSNNPEKRKLSLEEARNCIEFMTKIRVAKTTVGGFMVLRRPFQWRPFAPFFELFANLFTYPLSQNHLNDFELMKNCVDMLSEVARTDHESTYCGKLLRVANICLDFAGEYVNQALSHQGLQPIGHLSQQTTLPSRKHRLAETDNFHSQIAAKRVAGSEVPTDVGAAHAGVSISEEHQHFHSDEHLSQDPSLLYGGPGDNSLLGGQFDFIFDYSDPSLQAGNLFTDDMMWGGDEILAAIQEEDRLWRNREV